MASPKKKPKPKQPKPPEPVTKEEVIRLRITTDEKARFNAAATASGRTLSNWIRWIANREADGGKD